MPHSKVVAWHGAESGLFVDWLSETPDCCDVHINVKEVMAIVMALLWWPLLWANASVMTHMDSITARATINKAKAWSKVTIMAVVHKVFWWATIYKFKMRDVHIPGKPNVLADAIFWLHSKKSCKTLLGFLGAESNLSFHCWVLSVKSPLSIIRRRSSENNPVDYGIHSLQ